MAAKPPDIPPKTKALVEEADMETTDRVKRISGLADKMNRMNKDAQEATKKISSQVSSVMVKQKETDDILKEIKESPSTEIESMVPAVTGILDKLGLTVQRLATGMKDITVATARATKDAVSQYGKAISEDISINKQSVIAMTLARSTPIFGYFAAKFMETDVFKNAISKIKSRIGSAISSVTTTVGSKIRDLFSRKPKGVAEVAEKVTEETEAIPTMQRGGYIEKGGLARVHPAEAVIPIDDLLERIDERVKPAEETESMIVKGIGSLSKTSARLEKYVGTEDVRRKGLVRDFIIGFTKATNLQQETWQDRMLRATLDLKIGLVGMSSRLRLAWQRTLVLHPVFRTLIMLTTKLTKAFTFPFRFLFAARGRYLSMLRGATRPANAYEKMIGVLGLIFTEGMFKLDQLNFYVKQLLEFQTGEAKELKGPTWTIARKMLRGAAIPFEFAVKKLGEKQMIFSKEQAEMLTRERKGILGLFRKKKEVVPGRAAIDVIADASTRTEAHLAFFRGFFPGIERKSIETAKEQALEMKKTRKGVYEVSSGVSGMRSRLRKLGGSFWKYIMLAFTMLKSFIGPFISKVTSFTGMFLKGGFMTMGRGLASAIGPHLGPIMGVALAGAAGVAVGSIINKYLINPIVNKWYKALDERTKKSTDAAIRAVEEARRGAMAPIPGKERVEKRIATKIYAGRAGAMTAEERAKQVGIWGRTTMPLIEAEQDKYMQEHIGEYITYGHEQVNQLRSEWNKSFLSHFRGKSLFESPEKYGRSREESFLKYLKKKGKPLSEYELAKVSTYGGITEARRAETHVGTAEYVRRQSEIAAAGTKGMVEKLGSKIREGAKEVGSIVNKATTAMVTNLSLANSTNSNVTTPQLEGEYSGGLDPFVAQALECNTQ